MQISASETDADRINLSYRKRKEGEEWQDMNYPVYLEYTACNYGGRRAWFRCPAIGCGRRVANSTVAGSSLVGIAISYPFRNLQGIRGGWAGKVRDLTR